MLAAPPAEGLPKEMQFSMKKGDPRAMETVATAGGQLWARRNPIRELKESVARASLFQLDSGSRKGQKVMLSCGPLITPSSQAPRKGLASDPLSRVSSVFSLLQDEALSPRLWLSGFTSWRLTMDSGP